jgi:ornithine carbamoyltransferase
MDLSGRNLLKEVDLTKDEFLSLIDLAEGLRDEKRRHVEIQRMVGRNVALLFEKSSTRTRSAFEVAAHDQGAHVTYIGPEGSHFGSKESTKDSARVLGRMFDGIEFRGFLQETVEALGMWAGVPVWNGLTDEWHPTQMLADILTVRDHTRKPLEDVVLCYLGDARNNTARSLLVTGALLGMDIRIAGPDRLLLSSDVRRLADRLAIDSGARITVGSDISPALEGADFIYTDVWVSMGEPPSDWEERINELLPYQVDEAKMRATGNPETKFLHCLPALHDLETTIGREIHAKWGLTALEVTDAVFESTASVVFDQAENRVHTIKALMVATIGDGEAGASNRPE